MTTTPPPTVTFHAVLSSGRCVKFQQMTVGQIRAARAAAAARATNPLDLVTVHITEQNLLRSLVGITKTAVPWLTRAGSSEVDAKAMCQHASEKGLWQPLTWLDLNTADGPLSLDNLVTPDEYSDLLGLVRDIYTPKDAAAEAGVVLGEKRLVEILS